MNKEISIQAVSEAAYHIWNSEGRPDGRDEIHWQQALAQFEKPAAKKRAPAKKAATVKKTAATKAPVKKATVAKKPKSKA